MSEDIAEVFRKVIRESYKKETGEWWINSQGEPDLDYVYWLENRIEELKK